MLPSWISVSGGVRQWPSQSFANQRPFYKKFQSPERQHKSRFKIPFRALLLTCHCFVSGGQLNGLPLASSSSLAVYQSSSVTTIEYLLLVCCLGSLALGMDHPFWNANMKWSFPSISILVFQPLYFFGNLSRASPSREERKIRLLSGIYCAVWCSGFYNCFKKKVKCHEMCYTLAYSCASAHIGIKAHPSIPHLVFHAWYLMKQSSLLQKNRKKSKVSHKS